MGRRDTPTDGIQDYCAFLGAGLKRKGVRLEMERVEWDVKGWTAALRRLRRESSTWAGKWALLQYTALAWSRRGFPFRALAVLGILRHAGARVAVVFHEPSRQTQSRRRWIDRFRGACQDWVIHKLYAGASKCIFADPLERIDWLPNGDMKSAFIPIGANIPDAIPLQQSHTEQEDATKRVAIFGVTDHGEERRQRELDEIADAVRTVVAKGVTMKLLFMGRGTNGAGESIRQAMQGISAEVVILGLLSADRIAENLATSDAMLFVRGKIHPRRGTVMAGIACGLPIVGYAGMAEGTPLMDAGLELVPYGDREALGAALTRVLTDAGHRRVLRKRSVDAHKKHFSWGTIAKSYVHFLEPDLDG